MKPQHNKDYQDKKNPQQPSNPHANPQKKEQDKNSWHNHKKDGGCGGSCNK